MAESEKAKGTVGKTEGIISIIFAVVAFELGLLAQ